MGLPPPQKKNCPSPTKQRNLVPSLVCSSPGVNSTAGLAPRLCPTLFLELDLPRPLGGVPSPSPISDQICSQVCFRLQKILDILDSNCRSLSLGTHHTPTLKTVGSTEFAQGAILFSLCVAFLRFSAFQSCSFFFLHLTFCVFLHFRAQSVQVLCALNKQIGVQ